MSKKKTKNGKAAAAGRAVGAKAAKAKATEAEEPKAPKAEKAVEPKVSQAELDALRKPVEEVKALAEKARALVGEAKDAYAYTDKHVGPKEEVGNKGGRLSNRLRAVLNA